MKAVLVGGVESDKLYYIIDSGPGEFDGAIERVDGSVVKFDFFSFVTKSKTIRKIRTTRFHRYLWNEPRGVAAKNWSKVFISKNQEISEKMQEGIEAQIVTALGKNRKKIEKKNETVDKFIKALSSAERKETTACCGKVVQSDRPNTSFRSELQRKQAWVGRIVLNDITNIEHK